MLAQARTCAALVAIASGCNTSTTVPTQAAFDRPEALSFFCSDGTDIFPLAACTPANPEDTTMGSTEKDPPEPFELYAVVTQTGTGEVAAVQVTGETGDPAGVIDTDVRIPGFTFAAVGEVPSAVVTPPGTFDPSNPSSGAAQSQFTYVVSRGSSTMHVIETPSFRGPRGAKVTLVEASDGSPYFPPDSRPTSMELTPDQRELVITLPNLGEVWFAPIEGGTVGDPTRVVLSTDVPPAVDFTSAGGALPPSYEYTCRLTPVEVTPIPPRAPVSLGATPEPWGIEIDEENGRVLVADRSLPIIHVIDLETHAELTPIDVSVPTRELTLSPRVPSGAPQTIGAGAARDQRLLYAIDETDQSVLAVDYTDPSSSSFGGVLPISPSAPVDRLEVPFPARAIEVVAPRYTESGPLRICSDANDVSPAQLHGVFLAVAATDGRVRIYDIFDLDAPCRGNGCDAANSALANDRDNGVAIARNRPRIGAFIDDPASAVKIDPAPQWTLGASTDTVATTGVTSDARLPSLAAIECPDGLAQVFPVEGLGEPLVCAVRDPWAAISQRFEVAWNGTVPFTSASGAVLTGSTLEVRFDPCSLGVIGSEQVPADGHLSGYGGDVVAITSPLPAALAEDEVCTALVQETASGATTPVLLPILRATSVVPDADASTDSFSGRLEVGPPAGFALDEVARCFPDQLQVEVRVNGAFLVQSGRAGFDTPIVSGEGGECTVDPALADALHRGRAFPNRLFETSELAIELAGPAQLAPTEQAALTMTVTNVPIPLTFDVTRDTTSNTDLTSLLAALRYNPIDERLYIIDQATRGLVRLNLTSAANPIEGIFR